MQDKKKMEVRFESHDEVAVYSNNNDNDPDLPTQVLHPPSLTPSPDSDTSSGTSSTLIGEEDVRVVNTADDPRSLEMITSLRSPWDVRTPRATGYWDNLSATKAPLVQKIIIASTVIGVIVINCPPQSETIRVGDIYKAIQERLERPLTPDTPQYKALSVEGRCQVERSFRARIAHADQPLDEETCGHFMDLLADKFILADIVPYKGSESWKIVFKR